MTIISAFKAAIGRTSTVRASDKPNRARPGSDPSVDLADPNTLSKMAGVHIPVAATANYNYGTGYDNRTQPGEDAAFPHHEPDDPDVLYRLFRIRA